MPSPINISPRRNKFKRQQHKFTLILPQTAFQTFLGTHHIEIQQLLPYLNADVHKILEALKDADGDDFHNAYSYDISPSPRGPPIVKDGRLELRFRIDRNTADARSDLKKLDYLGLPGRGIEIPWTGAGRSVDVGMYLGGINVTWCEAEMFQKLLCEVAAFRQFARYL